MVALQDFGWGASDSRRRMFRPRGSDGSRWRYTCIACVLVGLVLPFRVTDTVLQSLQIRGGRIAAAGIRCYRQYHW